MDCKSARLLLPDLALGLLAGRERSGLLSHLESCGPCQLELERLSDVTEGLMGLAPEVEPPPGFETRVLARVLPDRGSTSPLSGWRRARRRTRNRWAAVAVVGSLLGGGTAGWWVGEHRAVPSANRGVDTSPLEEAGFVSGDRRVGELFAYRSGHPWVYMVIDAPQVSGVLTCQLRDASGRFVTVGSFDLRQGQGYWGAPVPAGAHIVAARLLDSTGRQVALARLAAHGSADPDPVS